MRYKYIIISDDERLCITRVDAKGNHGFGYGVEQAKRWKTHAGAQKAFARLCDFCAARAKIYRVRAVNGDTLAQATPELASSSQ